MTSLWPTLAGLISNLLVLQSDCYSEDRQLYQRLLYRTHWSFTVNSRLSVRNCFLLRWPEAISRTNWLHGSNVHDHSRNATCFSHWLRSRPMGSWYGLCARSSCRELLHQYLLLWSHRGEFPWIRLAVSTHAHASRKYHQILRTHQCRLEHLRNAPDPLPTSRHHQMMLVVFIGFQPLLLSVHAELNFPPACKNWGLSSKLWCLRPQYPWHTCHCFSPRLLDSLHGWSAHPCS